jgi:hypothetical protein
VIFRKLTNGFRSEWGAKVYADLCSIVATGRLAGRWPKIAPANLLMQRLAEPKADKNLLATAAVMRSRYGVFEQRVNAHARINEILQ